MCHYLLLLAIVPLGCYEFTKLRMRGHRCLLLGIGFGLVVAPIGCAFLQLSTLPIIGKLLGLAGLFCNLLHGWLGYCSMVAIGALTPGTVLTPVQFILVNLINALFFANLYGTIGFLFDRARARKGLVRKVVFS